MFLPVEPLAETIHDFSGPLDTESETAFADDQEISVDDATGFTCT